MNNYLSKNAFLFYSSYFRYKDNVMPVSGGYLEQSNSFIVNANFFDRVINKQEKIKQDRRRRNGR